MKSNGCFPIKDLKREPEIGEYVGYVYTKELIRRKHNIIIEALPDEYTKKLLPLLRRHNYKITQICLQAPLEQCIRNNAARKKKGYSPEVIREVYDKLLSSKGNIIDVTDKSAKQIYNIIKKKYF